MKLEEATGLADPRRLVEQIVLRLSNPLNRHLVKLVAFDFPPEMAQRLHDEQPVFELIPA